MRKRCFLIAAIALVLGVYFNVSSYPSESDIQHRKNFNKHMEESYEAARMFNERIGDYSTTSSGVDPYAQDSESVGISRVSFALAAVLLLVGFIIGPPKR